MNTPIIVEQFTKASPAAIWQALTNREIMKEWYFTIDDFVLEEGATFNFYEGPEKQFHHQCTIKTIELEKKFAHTWTHPNQSKGTSLVTWEIIPQNEGTLIRLKHEGTENLADAGAEFSRDNFEMGWKGIVQSTLKNYLNGIKTLNFETNIKAEPERVWEQLWDKEAYKKWCSVFGENSRYTGEIGLGKRIYFLGGEGQNGMYSDIVYLSEPKIIVFSHIGMLKDGKELPVDAETEVWTRTLEKYMLEKKDGETMLRVALDCMPGHEAFMQAKFPEALKIIKNLSENNH